MKKCRDIQELGKEITRCGGHKTLVADYPEDLQIKDDKRLIDCFEDRMCRWFLKPAEILLETKRGDGKEDPDVDFAVLAILNAVPEMLAQFQGCEDNYKGNRGWQKTWLWRSLNPILQDIVVSYIQKFRHSQGDNKHIKKYLYEQGLQYIFPWLENDKHKNQIMKRLYGKLRNAIAHMGLTSTGIILERGIKNPIMLCQGRDSKLVVIVNVPKWYEQTKKRVKDYISELRDPDPSKDDLRRKFRKRMEASN